MDSFLFPYEILKYVSLPVVVLSAVIYCLEKRLGLLYQFQHKVNPESNQHGGELVAKVLQAHGVKNLFTLVGGHVSPILVAAEKLGIRVVDTRHEVTAVFAADAVARLSGTIGVAVVTAGPGVTNTVTAMKNAQMAESPVLLLGGAAATLLKGRGALQDIDQLSLFRSLCKSCYTVVTVREIVPTLKEAIRQAMSGTPGPVFVELPIDVLYPYKTVSKEIGMKTETSSFMQRLVNWYLGKHLNNLFAGAWETQSFSPLPISIPQPTADQVQRCVEIISRFKKPVMLIGSQATLPPTPSDQLQKAILSLGIPVYLGGMARGLLGKNSPLQMKQNRREALKEADLVILAGAVCDFRLSYGRTLSRKSKIIAINRDKTQLFKNSDLFWKPTEAVIGDVGSFLTQLSTALNGYTCDPEWIKLLRDREIAKETANKKMAESLPDKHLNPLKVLHVLDDVMADDAIMVADGGDFVGSAAYILRPRGPLQWLDPGAFGTLGVGGGFALGAKLCRPDSEVWIVYGDGSCGYSLAEYDTFTRHKIPIISIVGNDAGWTQIAREQVPMFGSDVACGLAYTDYHRAAEAFGGKGFVVERKDNESIETILKDAQKMCREKKVSVLINVLLGKSKFREGSISV